MVDPIQPRTVGQVTDFGYVPQTGPDFTEIAGGLGAAALSLTQTFATGGLGGIAGMGGQAQYGKLLQEQNRIQQESLVYTAKSNASKSEADSKKAIVGNWRTS